MNNKLIIIFVIVSIIISLMLLNIISCDNYISSKPIKIRIIDAQTSKPLVGISVYHLIIYNSYDKTQIPFDMCGLGWFQIVANQYFSDSNGYVYIPFTKVFINKLTEGKYYDSVELLINSDTEAKLFDKDFKIITPKPLIEFNQLYSKYRLYWGYLDNFYKINKKYSSLLLNIIDVGEYNEKELNDLYSKHGINFKIVKNIDSTKIYEIKLFNLK